MAFIAMVTDDQAATGDAARLFDRARETYGYVPNHTRLFARRPAVYDAWRQLVEAVSENMDDRRYELATIGAASKLRSSYCTLAHGKVLADRFLTAPSVRDVVLDHHTAGLDEIEIAVMDLAEKVVDDATSVIPADVERLRDLGLSDNEIFDVVLAAAARCFFSKTLTRSASRPMPYSRSSIRSSGARSRWEGLSRPADRPGWELPATRTGAPRIALLDHTAVPSEAE